MNTKLVTIAVFTLAFHAQLLKGRLEADGIESYVQDEHTVSANPVFNNALGGVKLQVKEEDVPLAVNLLRYSGYRTVFDTIPENSNKKNSMFIQFLKFMIAGIAIISYLYFIDFKAK